MKRHGSRRRWLLLGTAVVAGTAAWGAVTPEEESPVEVRFAGVGMERDVFRENGIFQESPLRLQFHVFWSLKYPWRFDDLFGRRIQYLEVTDSAGRKLAPAEFDLERCFIMQSGDCGMVLACITGRSGELPRPDVSWMRLKGIFRVPLARLEQSPVYEVSAMKGADVSIVLPGAEGEDGGANGDIAGEQGSPMGIIFLKEYETLEKEGKTMVKAEIGVETDFPFELDRLELLNDRDEAVDIRGMDDFSCENGFSKVWTKKFQFEKPEKMEKLRLRMVYKVSKGEVPVPVDVRLGMWGEIR